jgi:hypothetical protein
VGLDAHVTPEAAGSISSPARKFATTISSLLLWLRDRSYGP